MIAVDAVLAQQFPVCREAVLLRAADDFHTDFGLIHHEVDEFSRAGEVRHQIDRVAVVVDEVQAAILIELRHLHEVVHTVDVRTLRIAFRAGTIDQLALQIERPRVIEAAEHLVVAAFLAAHHRASMRAGIEERAHAIVFSAHEDELASPDRSRQEVAFRRHFRFVTNVQPAGVEDVAAFALENGGIDEHTPVHTEQAARAVFGDIRLDDRLGFDGAHPRIPFTYRVDAL